MATKLRRNLAADRQAGLDSIPAEALRFDAGRFQFAAKTAAADGNRPISMLARTAQPIEHWYFGKIVHDMAGMKTANPTLPIDYCHDCEEILGYLDKFDASNAGLTVSGQIVSFQADDRSAEIVHKADAGVPYQASIAFDPNTYILEIVPEGMQAPVNGYALEGPACIVRQWTLVAVSVCPYGADSGTRTNLAGDAAADVAVQFTLTQDPAMSKTPETKPASAETKLAQPTATQQPATELAAETKPAASETAADPRAEFQATLAKFTAAFGPANGAQWAAEGLSYEAALEKHAAQLAASNQTLTSEKAELAAKLAAVPRGEAEPVSFTTTDKHAGGQAVPTKYAGLGKLATFAANLKLPNAAK